MKHQPGVYVPLRALFLVWENVTMMDSLEIIASYDLEFGLLCKQND